MEDNIFMKIVGIIAIGIVTLVLILCLFDSIDTHFYVTNGYEKVIVMGSSTTVWQKAD